MKHAVLVGLGTFFFAVFISSNSQVFLNRVKSIVLAFVLLIIIIVIGIVFDIIGIAATSAQEAPFHARASRKLKGARQSIWLVRNADKTANFCNDVVGDICGTVSGSIGAFIVFGLAANSGTVKTWILSTAMTGMVAALTVGGKAAGKSTAINQADRIIQVTGQILSWFARTPKGTKPLKGQRKGKHS